MSSAQAVGKASQQKYVLADSAPQRILKSELVFIDDTPKSAAKDGPRRKAQRKLIRSHATRASTHARLETTRRRAESKSDRQPGQGIFRIQDERLPLATKLVEQKDRTLIRRYSYRDWKAFAVLHAQTLLGGPIPASQASIAILGHFLRRFEIGRTTTTDRPWVKLVMSEATSPGTSSLVSTALQANATALSANDLQSAELRIHSIKLYSSAIARLRSALQSREWHDPVVMYTAMILTLFETIQTQNPSASNAHVSGVATLIQQKGPQSFVHGLEHRTFRYYRINIVLLYLAQRRPCFLAEPEWRTIPFSGDCEPKAILDLLLDILAEIPGVLSAIEALTNGTLGQFTMIQKAFELVYWVRRLLSDLERWKHDSIFTYPLICANPGLKKMGLLTLCDVVTNQTPHYDPRLGEAVNCYAGAHLILTRIARRLAERSFLISAALRPAYTLGELVAAVVIISEKHIADDTADMISMIVTAFPLKVAQTVDELHQPTMFKSVKELLAQINDGFVRKYNIHYKVNRDTNAYEI